jgi:pimeloyl-ACP methyl ester carboxylesterase
MLRKALGYETWNVVGVSYGARLALYMMEAYPKGIRSVVLDSVYPPGINAYEARPVNGAQSLTRLFEACRKSPSCANAYPDLNLVADEIILSLDQQPVQLTVLNPQTGEHSRLYLDGYSFSNLLFMALHHHETLARIPYAIYQLHYGKYEAIAGLMFPTSSSLYDPTMLQNRRDTMSVRQGAFFARECPEEVAYNKLAAAQTQAKESGSVFADHLIGDITQLFNICQDWAPILTTPTAPQPSTSRIPTLILSGEYDPVTPAAWSEAASANLPNSYFYVFPGLGHNVLKDDRCPRLMMADFLVDPTMRTADTCREKLDLTFWVP